MKVNLFNYEIETQLTFERSKRKSYIILSSILCIITCLTLGLIPTLPILLFMIILTIDSMGGAIKDVAVDGLMVEEGKKNNLCGKIQSVQWGALTFATILTGVGGGYIAEKADYHLSFLLIMIFPILIALFSLKYKEEKVKKEKTSAKVICNKYVELFKSKQFLLSALFLFLLWFSPSIGTPIFAKMRDELHMSKIWIGWLSTIGSISSMIGAIVYFKVSKKINLKKWLYISTIISTISTFAYLYLTAESVLVYNIIFGVAGMFTHLIIMSYMAEACPKGTEATAFALLCSIVNFGSFLSGIVGGQLYNFLGYNGLVIISGLTTAICLAFIPYLKVNAESIQ